MIDKILVVNELFKKEVVHQASLDSLKRVVNGQPHLYAGIELLRICKMISDKHYSCAVDYLTNTPYYNTNLYQYIINYEKSTERERGHSTNDNVRRYTDKPDQ